MSGVLVQTDQIRHTFCGVCSSQCPLDAYVQNGVIVRVEGTKPPYGSGYLCAKGYANRGYVYHEGAPGV